MARFPGIPASALSLLLLLCLQAGAEPEVPESWSQRLTEARRVLQATPRPEGFRPTVTAAVRKGEAAIPVEADIKGLTHVWLVVNDGGDGFNCDHAVWGNPVFVGADGAKTSLTDLPPLAAKVGWFSFQVRKNERVAGTPFPLAWFAHSPSYACFAVPEGTVRFEAFGGILDSACGGKVGFEVQAGIPADRAAEAFWNQLKKDFPEQSAWIEADLPDGAHLRWLAAGGAENRRLIDAALATLAGGGAQLRARADEYTAAKLPSEDPRWLHLYLETRARAARVREVLAAADFARRTLDMVEQAAPRPALHQELAALDTRIGNARQNPATDWAAELAACQALRRRILFTHPALDFPDLLINKRPPPTFSHQCDQYLGRHSRPGPGLVVLHDWKSDQPRETPLLANQLPAGTTAHPALSYDAKRIAFSFCDHTVERKEWRRFLIYEIGVDGGGLRQLTGTPNDDLAGWESRRTVLVEDFDPCYLPDGGIAFISTRCQTFGRCHHRRYNPSYLLYRMNGDGTGIRQISFGEANEWDPSVLHDGRLIWTRWDYINRHDTYYQSLWTTRPDGTSTAHFYGNYTRNPCMTAEPRAIPGSHRVVSTAMAHHGYTAGSIIAIDPHLGQDGLEPVTRLTPDVPFPETEGWDIPRIYCSPWPLNEDLYFVAYSPKPLATQGKYQETNAFQICLIDRLGGRETVYVDPDMSCFDPIPLVPRPVPPAIPSMLPENPVAETGIIYLENANLSHPPMPDGVRIHALRVNSIHGQPTPSVPHRGKVRQEIVKRIEGYAPVDGNGGASFRAPANMPLQLQALDENGMAVMTMRSFIYLQPGEYLSCVGCHEQRASAPPVPRRVAIPEVAELAPPAGPRYPGGFSFKKTVQPVLDRHCIACHGLAPEPAAKLDLLGTRTTFPIDGYPGWPRDIHTTASYESLLHRPGLVRIAQRNEETARSKPDDYFARAGKLARFLLEGHCPALLEDRDGLRRIIDWLDLNAQYNGDYSWNRDEDRQPEAGGEKALREFLTRRFGPELAAQPFAALVNVGLPEQSRVLLTALPAGAGGWGQLPHAFPDRNDQGYQQLESLVRQAIAPAAHQDHEGTCAQTPCICGSCWVREAGDFWRKRAPALAARPE